MKRYIVNYQKAGAFEFGQIMGVLDELDELENIKYLTNDGLCVCNGECTTWCYVDKKCLNKISGYTGYYQYCDNKKTYNSEDANKKVEENKEILRIKHNNLIEKIKQHRLLKEKKLRQQQLLKGKKIQILLKNRQKRSEKINNEEITKKLINKCQIILQSKKIKATITGLIHQNIAITFKGIYNHYPVIIKFTSSEGKSHKEGDMQESASPISPQIYLNHNNEIIIMEYLSEEAGWIPFNEFYIFDKFINTNIKSINKKICKAIDILSDRNIDHRSLKDDNILFNYKSGEIKILDYESSIISSDNTNNNFYDCI